ncbi:MAG: ABC transporter permease, partial [Alphaproteobacteria bacterium]|nr:ABC transporter permease [Alphaproteobacteria bacterium]
MLTFALRRLGTSVVMLIVLSVIVFVLLRLAPGDPIDAYLDPSVPMSQAELAAARTRLGLDQPLPVQYLAWMRAALAGDLGFSLQRNHEPVARLLAERVGPTLLLMGCGLLLAIVIGVAAGVVSAVNRGGPLDIALSIPAFGAVSSPAFLTALVGLFVFSVTLRWAPSGGMRTPGVAPTTGDLLAHLVLPALLLSIGHAAMIMRYMRASLLEVLNQDYVRTARAKGVPERWVVIKHAVRNALLPVVTLIGSTIGAAVGGAVFIESIFSWPGMGLLLVNAVEARDYPVIMAATLVVGACVLLANMLTDIAYAG